MDGIDLRVERGEVLGLLDPNGAGETTTILVINTVLPVQEGSAEVLGVRSAALDHGHKMAARLSACWP